MPKRVASPNRHMHWNMNVYLYHLYSQCGVCTGGLCPGTTQHEMPTGAGYIFYGWRHRNMCLICNFKACVFINVLFTIWLQCINTCLWTNLRNQWALLSRGFESEQLQNKHCMYSQTNATLQPWLRRATITTGRKNAKWLIYIYIYIYVYVHVDVLYACVPQITLAPLLIQGKSVALRQQQNKI